MKCPNCGETSRIREKDKFCHKCGVNLKEAEKAAFVGISEIIDTDACVDKTIRHICTMIQNGDVTPGEYAETIKALAALVEARALLK